MNTLKPKGDNQERQGHSGDPDISPHDALVVGAGTGGAGGYGTIPDFPDIPSGSSPPSESDSLLGNAFQQLLQHDSDEHAKCHHSRRRSRWQRFWDLVLGSMEAKVAKEAEVALRLPLRPPTELESCMDIGVVVLLLLGSFFLAKWCWDELRYVCLIDDGKVSQLSLSFDPNQYKDFFLHLDQNINGDVFVGQTYNNNNNPNITVQVTARASSPDVLEVLALDYWPTPQLSFMEANVYLNMSSEQARKKAFRKGCTLVRVDILFPANLTSYQSLRIHHQERGNVNMKMRGIDTATSPEAAAVTGETVSMTVGRLDIKVYAGWVTLQDVVVSDELKVVSTLGGIDAQVDIHQRAIMSSAANLVLKLGSSSPNLDVKVTSRRKARVVVKTPYVGHVAMTTTSNNSIPALFVPRSRFVKQIWTAQSLIGYVPDSNNEEPEYLPRIEIGGKASVVELLA